MLAESLGFHFHSAEGVPYWDESVFYGFSLRQIEADIEEPTGEIESLCMDLVDEIVRSEYLLRRMAVPNAHWEMIATSWKRREPALYGRMDLSYDGKAPARFYEYNADTPTSLYEAAFFQWLWLEQSRERGTLPLAADQYNIIQDALVKRVAEIGDQTQPFHVACCAGHLEDMATATYLADCIAQAGMTPVLTYIDDIGHGKEGFVDLSEAPISQLFKLYPWEWMFQEDFSCHIGSGRTRFIEPAWKSLLSNKAILPLLWERHPGHPNLIPACFADTPQSDMLGTRWVRKPFFSREGANINVETSAGIVEAIEGPYREGPQILQAWCPPPDFGGLYPIIGSWLVGGKPVGMGIREDQSPITQDRSRFIPHAIIE
ncbi:glutathionylspermidine synthase family protein [Billgrantia sp. Q4P2]|uniref:glutathionylspermidine synthase family protein n=1 Tax=Billgrantia sp. Q4P2 TaxID=3463857 RepID=UPI00405749ED